ncbi:MAG: hypothetical protein ACTSXL_02450 [Alphaproteobacteria bacterium]
MLENILKITKKLKADMESHLPFLDEQIDLIIKNEDRSPEKIEGLLDTFLDLAYMGIGEKEFKKLNGYYGGFCKEYASQYQEFYDEIMRE